MLVICSHLPSEFDEHVVHISKLTPKLLNGRSRRHQVIKSTDSIVITFSRDNTHTLNSTKCEIDSKQV